MMESKASTVVRYLLSKLPEDWRNARARGIDLYFSVETQMLPHFA